MKPVSLNSVELPSSVSEVHAQQQTQSNPAAAEEFASTLGNAIEPVEQLQTQADTEAQKLANGAGNLHETMLALEKADVAMRIAMKVRTKLLDAYNEVMRMTV